MCDWPASSGCVENDEIVTKKPVASTTITYDDDDEISYSTTKRTTSTTKTTRKPPAIITNRPTTPKPYNKPNAHSEPCTNGEYKPNIDSCESYLICVNHKWILRQCEYGFQFDQTSLECNYASKVRCVSASRYLKFVGKLDRLQLDDACEGQTFVVSIKCQKIHRYSHTV